VDLLEVSRVRSLTKAGRAREIRVHACVSAAEVAAALGVSPSTVLRWEEGERAPRGDIARRYGELLEGLEGVKA
jgi:DNA-binding transcriptional regulator YiaG